ncbi:MAG: S8 family serine peptidase [Nevskia sp.]|nr:S8 family serine peptidase [Nevskia sp.]
MNVSTPFKSAFVLLAAVVSGSSLSSALSGARAQALAQDTDVIVILNDQLEGTPPARGNLLARANAVAAAQAPVLAELRQAGALRTRQFRLVNMLAARVSKDEVARLKAHPSVRAVVEDRTQRLQPRQLAAGLTAGGASRAVAGADTATGLCGTLEPEALQLTNAAFLDPTVPQAQTVKDGNGQPVTGKGVKVAYIADGLDPTSAGFVRPDGSKVFFDYQDFSGDPAGTPTGGAEAFGDASSIAAQDNPNGTTLLFDISQFVAAAHPLPSPCNIQIRGMAPGASLAGLKAFSNLGLTTTSTLVQAIEWAVIDDDVDVLNESFGANPFPDTDNDPISLANSAAVRAGVTVVVSTGDAGSAGTLGSPSTNLDVIAAGASTQYRLYAQTGSGAIPLGSGGYLSNNISPLSSGGFAQTGARTVDVVAPGDLGWALCSTNNTLFTECASLAGTTTPLQDFGGTSESAPLTSGEAALVIQAYRSTHHGATPAPALVKRIIMSTATDLGAPVSEQGAGLINALAAVNAALSAGASGHGQSLLFVPDSAAATDLPNTPETRFFTVTNTGTTTQHLTPTLETLGPAFGGATLNLTLDPTTDPTFPNASGAPRSYIEQTFTVPAGAQHLDAAIAVQVPPGSTKPPIAYLSLLDPEGRQATYSVPQGFGSGYGHVDVTMPEAGTWTAVISTRPTGVTGSYSGPVQFTWAVEHYTKLGSVLPSALTLAPGASSLLIARFNMPSQPGDTAAAIRFNETAAGGPSGFPAIPLTARTLVPLGPTGATFTGTLTGGNGRAGAGPTQTYAFDVPPGSQNLALTVGITDSGYLLEGILVDPNGMELSVQPNLDPTGSTSQNELQIFRYQPQPGRWRFVLLQNFTSSGNQTALHFAAAINLYSTSQVVSASLPNDPTTKISASGSLTVPVQVANIGAASEWFFVDARLRTPALVTLGTQPQCANKLLQGACELLFVPTEASAVRFVAQSDVPINMDIFNTAGYNVGATGAPDLWAYPVAKDTVAASLMVPEVPFGPWIMAPSLVGPYSSGGASTTQPVTTAAVALMQPFDPTVSATSGDVWADLVLGTNTFNPVTVAAGGTATIQVTFKPAASQVGKVVSGYLYIDTFNLGVLSGDEVVRIPYSFSVGP